MNELGIVRRRLVAQRLTGAPFATAAEAVSALGAVQGQEWAEVKWSLAERVAGATDASLEAAFARGAFLRTHVLRPTWHVVAPQDIRWLLALTAPRVHVRIAPYYRRHGLDDTMLARGDAVLVDALADGAPRTRAELRAALADAGIEGDGTRLAHVFMHAELGALICSGPRRGAQHTYALLEHRAPPGRAFERDEALAELTLRYFTSHGPATAYDFAWWSGLTVTDARAGLAMAGDRLERAETWFAAPGAFDAEPIGTGAHLVPMYDESTIAYREARIVLARRPPRAGLIQRPIVIDGRTVGSWRRVLQGRTAILEATLFVRLGRAATGALDDAVARYAAFLERAVALRTEVM